MAVVAAAESDIPTPDGRGLDSDGVLRRIAEGLDGLGFQVERSKAASDQIARPVLFGDEDLPSVTMHIDAFQDRHGIAGKVEAGRAWNGNAVYRDLIRTSLLLDANYLVMLLPLGYRPRSAKSSGTSWRRRAAHRPSAPCGRPERTETTTATLAPPAAPGVEPA